jgi:hypothetical protein
MAAINLSTLGVQLHYAVESEKGTMPTSGFTRIYGIKSTPSLNPAPDTIETTTLDELEYKTYVDGLKDLGGALEFTFNLTQELTEKWDALMDAYEAAKVEGKRTWFAIVIPGLTDAFYFPGNPSAMGLPETSVNAVLEITNYITPVGAPVKATKPTA